jgi:hypothetical protein
MKWVKHDTNAHNDAKLQNVLLDYGLEGYGLYWYCIELIAGRVDKDNITFELEHDARIIAKNTGSTAERVTNIMQYFIRTGLFESDEGVVTCLKLARRLDQSMTSNPQMREIIQAFKLNEAPELPKPDQTQGELLDNCSVNITDKCNENLPNNCKGGENNPVDNQEVNNSHDPVMISSDKVMQDKTRLDKTRVDNKNNSAFDVNAAFVEFWAEWPKSYDQRKTAHTKFKSKCKSKKTFNLIMSGLIAHKPELLTRENQFIPAAATWLNQERYLDEPAPPRNGPGPSGGGGNFSGSDYGTPSGSL